MKLSEHQRESIREVLRTMCGGTPLQPNADFVAGYIGQYVIGLVENRDEVFKEDKDEMAIARCAPEHDRRRVPSSSRKV